MRDFLWEMDNIIVEPKKSQVGCLQDAESGKQVAAIQSKSITLQVWSSEQEKVLKKFKKRI